jgi:hypothetical protein
MVDIVASSHFLGSRRPPGRMAVAGVKNALSRAASSDWSRCATRKLFLLWKLLGIVNALPCRRNFSDTLVLHKRAGSANFAKKANGSGVAPGAIGFSMSYSAECVKAMAQPFPQMLRRMRVLQRPVKMP